ncbi:hypothetical protein [Marinagarivorans algicola]|uniref:hypothetical protein n=1 Tax=Marinagarivorans algicola TaxID=1513270 RepID=UPI0006B976B0|nr:hypothetical protein [Marinagarivorans algicola]
MAPSRNLFTRHLFFVLMLIMFFGLLGGCGGASIVDEGSSSSDSSVSHSSVAAEEPSCEAPVGLALTDIDSVVEWINAMPKPLTLPCFITSLPRPMYYNATKSIFSAQRSKGKRSPRVFFLIDKLVLTVVPDEQDEPKKDPETGLNIKDPVTGRDKKFWDVDGVQLLEVSLEVDTDLPTRQSIKGEFKFPITETLSRKAPYVDINLYESNELSSCALCHKNETQIEVIDGQPVYRSAMLRNREMDAVTLGFMLNEYSVCDPEYLENEWYRCEMLEAIYGQGTLVWKSFAEDIETF